MVRSIPLEPGLNIVTALDVPAADGAAALPGHGVGKTSFCRLLRFGLGDHLDLDLQGRLTQAFEDPRLVLLVDVDGEPFTVVRSVLSPERAAVFPGDVLHEAARVSLYANGIRRLRSIIDGPASDAAAPPWATLLPVVTREQEARRAIDVWRTTASGTAEKRTADLLKALGIFSTRVGEADDADAAARAADKADVQLDTAHSTSIIVRHAVGVLRERLKAPASASDDPSVVVEALVEAAAAHIDPSPPEDLELKRAALQALVTDIEHEEAGLVTCVGAIEEARVSLGILDEKRRDLEARRAAILTTGGTSTHCACCGQSLGTPKARAHHKAVRMTDLEGIDSQLASIATRLAEMQSDLDVKKALRREMNGRLMALRTRRIELEGEIHAIEMKHDEQRVRAAVVLEDAQQLRDLVWRSPRSPKARAARARPLPETEILQRRERLQSRFGAVMQVLVGDDSLAELRFEGNALSHRIERSGPLGGAALNVLSVLAFDVAAMLLRGEGVLPGPAFLVHDSPRDGDMSPILYAGYLETLGLLHDVGGHGFQMIVTTTTDIPAILQGVVRARLTARPEERLFGRAL